MPSVGGPKMKTEEFQAPRRSENLLRIQMRGHADICAKTPAEVQEAMQKRDQLLRQLVKIDQSDLLKKVLQPEIVHISNRQDILNTQKPKVSIQGPRAETEIIARRVGSEPGSRAVRPAYESLPERTMTHSEHSKVPRDVILGIQNIEQ